MAFDAHKNFAYSLIAVAPTPAASGTTFNVTAGEGAIFPAVPFNVVVWPAGSNPSTTNAEVARVTSKGTGDNWTVTRTQEASSARAIAVGDQVAAAITAKTLTDVETAQAADAVAIAAATVARVPGGRLTLTTAVPVTTADVTAATTLYYALHMSNVIALYSGTAWVDRTFAELSIAIPGTTNQMYDVFIYDNAAVATLELLAWTNDTTRATALVRQDGHLVKSGATTRLYVGSIRTTGVSGQTEDSAAKRFLWNHYHRDRRFLQRTGADGNYTYSLGTFRQVNANTANRVEVIIGVAEVTLSLTASHWSANSTASQNQVSGIGEDSTTVLAVGQIGMLGIGSPANVYSPIVSTLIKKPTVGYHAYNWLERVNGAVATATWYTNGYSTEHSCGLLGWVEG